MGRIQAPNGTILEGEFRNGKLISGNSKKSLSNSDQYSGGENESPQSLTQCKIKVTHRDDLP